MKNHRNVKNSGGALSLPKGLITPFQNMAKDFSKLGKSAKKTISTVVYGASDYSPKVRKIISDYGNQRIIKITIGRTPVSEVLTKVLSSMSSNFKENVDNMPYDKLFHLFILAGLENGTTVRLEKNEVINADLIQRLTPDTELKEVSSVPNNLSLNSLLSNAQSVMGSNYFKYSARDNNCQDYIMGLFNGSNIGNNEDREFIKQNTRDLFNNTGFLRKFSNTVTETGARFNALMNGAGAATPRVAGKIKKLKMKGDNGLTDVQIMAILKQKRIPCHGCFVKDELKSIKNGNYIINLNGQSHWCALIKRGTATRSRDSPEEYIWFDSYGFPAPEQIEDLIEGKYYYNTSEIQGLQQTSCGYYCIALLKYLMNTKDIKLNRVFESFLNLFSENKSNNQLLIKQMLNLQ